MGTKVNRRTLNPVNSSTGTTYPTSGFGSRTEDHRIHSVGPRLVGTLGDSDHGRLTGQCERGHRGTLGIGIKRLNGVRTDRGTFEHETLRIRGGIQDKQEDPKRGHERHGSS